MGEQDKENNYEHLDTLMSDADEGLRTIKCPDFTENVPTYNLDGLRLNVVNQKNGLYFIDAWQRAIVVNANTECPGDDGNWSGDDEAKERGIKYVVTGQCESTLIQTATIGEFDSVESLPDRYLEQIRSVFQRNGLISERIQAVKMEKNMHLTKVGFPLMIVLRIVIQNFSIL